jgi:hypothetical protein
MPVKVVRRRLDSIILIEGAAKIINTSPLHYEKGHTSGEEWSEGKGGKVGISYLFGR